MVLQCRGTGKARDCRSGNRENAFRSETMGKHLFRLDARYSALVHQPAALVGPSDSGLVRARWANLRRDGGSGSRRIGTRGVWERGSPETGRGCAGYLVFFRALAVFHAGLARTNAGAAKIYPTDVLVTGFDIIFFWVARMMMMGLHFMGDVPFRTVCIHGLVRDERGQKMSKSRGNVIDPLELIEQYGADALRFAIAAATGPGRDIKLGAARVEGARNFVTKLWNAARFCEMHGVSGKTAFQPETARLPLCRWVLDAANRAIEDATAALEAYRFDEYAQVCYKFTWNTFCDWFLEFAKPALEDAAAAEEVRGTASYVLGTL